MNQAVRLVPNIRKGVWIIGCTSSVISLICMTLCKDNYFYFIVLCCVLVVLSPDDSRHHFWVLLPHTTVERIEDCLKKIG